jgi:hypothetical protein
MPSEEMNQDENIVKKDDSQLKLGSVNTHPLGHPHA